MVTKYRGMSVSLTLTLGLKYEWTNNMGASMKHKAWVLWVIQRSKNQLKSRENFRKLKGKLSPFHWKSKKWTKALLILLSTKIKDYWKPKLTSTQRPQRPLTLVLSHNHGPKEASQELERTEAQQWIKIIFESSPKSINKWLAEYQ